MHHAGHANWQKAWTKLKTGKYMIAATSISVSTCLGNCSTDNTLAYIGLVSGPSLLLVHDLW